MTVYAYASLNASASDSQVADRPGHNETAIRLGERITTDHVTAECPIYIQGTQAERADFLRKLGQALLEESGRLRRAEVAERRLAAAG